MSNNTVRKIHIVYKEGRRRKVNVSPYQQPPVAGSNPATSSKKDVRKDVFFLSLSGVEVYPP